MIQDIEIKLLVDCQQYLPELSQLWYKEISQHWVPDASIEHAYQNLMKHLNRDTLPVTFVAIFEGKPVGMVSLRETDGIQPGVTPWLGSLVVNPNYRKQKIGESLIEKVKFTAKSIGHEMLYLLAFDVTIPKWYAKLGWKKIGDDCLFNHPVTVMKVDL